jgi:hypothetical protein
VILKSAEYLFTVFIYSKKSEKVVGHRPFPA